MEQKLMEHFTVKNDDCISHLDASLPDLLGTYVLVKWMEIVSAKLLNTIIKDTYITVGQQIDISHLNMVKMNKKVQIESKLIENSKRKMEFYIVAKVDGIEVANAKHIRIIISKKLIDRQLKSL